MCDVMPTISEDGNSSQGDRDSQASGEGTNVEDMLLSILDERDRLMESLHDAQDQLVFTQNRLAEAERERDVLNRQLSEKLPEVSKISSFVIFFNEYYLKLCNYYYYFYSSMSLSWCGMTTWTNAHMN